MSKPKSDGERVQRPSVQPIVSHNVRILMAFKGVQQQGIALVVGKTTSAVGHKLAGRSSWTLDEVECLAEFGGPKWPVSRFFVDPERETEPSKVTLASTTPKAPVTLTRQVPRHLSVVRDAA